MRLGNRLPAIALAGLLYCALARGACAASLHMMVQGDHAIEVADTKQLTSAADGMMEWARISPDGKYTACRDNMFGRCIVVPNDGGSAAVAVEGMDEKTADTLNGGGEVSYATDGAWSPDSRSLALIVQRATGTPGSPGSPGSVNAAFGVALWSAKQRRVFCPFPDSMSTYRPPMWSPDGKRLALILQGQTPTDDGKVRPIIRVVALDVSRRQYRLVYEADVSESIGLVGWAPDGGGVMCSRSVGKDGREWIEISADGSGRTSPLVKPQFRMSPDGAFTVSDPPNECIMEANSASAEPVLKIGGTFAGWAPSGGLFAFTRETPIDDGGKRSESVGSLWVGVTERQKLNQMLVAHAVDPYGSVSWSSDGMRLSYTFEGKAFAAALKSRPLNTSEKVAAGFELTDEELQLMVMNNAKQAANALNMYSQDYDGLFPDVDSSQRGLYPYLKNNDVLNFPGTDRSIYHQLFFGSLDSIQSPAETVVAYMDAGRGWVMDIYADGHVKRRLKK